jgi:hypothetical protein
MNRPDQHWERLVSEAHRAPARPMPEAPLGFATRVVARWREHPLPSLVSVWKMLSLRVLAFGCVVMVASLAASYGVIREQWLEPPPDIAAQVLESAAGQVEEVLLP